MLKLKKHTDIRKIYYNIVKTMGKLKRIYFICNRSLVPLSVILTGRNDDRAEKQDLRFRLLEKSLQYALKNVPFEIVFVEWNPWPRRSLLGDYLTHERTVHVVVPQKSHMKAVNRYTFLRTRKGKTLQKESAFLLNLAINVGLRISRGKFVLVTNIDNIFPPEFGDLFIKKHSKALAISNHQLMKKKNDIIDERIKRVNKVALQRRMIYRVERKNVSSDLLQIFNEKSLIDHVIEYARNHIIPGTKWRNYPPWKSACGDFLLMDRATWYAIGGFPELPGQIHADTITLLKAIHLGCDVALLDWCIYHIDHGFRQYDMPDTRYDKRNILMYFNRNWGRVEYEVIRSWRPIKKK